MKKNVFAKLALIAATGFAVNAFAVTANTTFQVLFKVNKSCSVSAADLNLGEVDSTGLNVVAGTSGTVTVNCSKNTPYTIGLLPSGGAAVGTGSMAAQNVAPTTGNTDTVAYALFSNVGMTTAWGNTPGGNTVGGTGTGSAQTAVPVYGKVTGSVNVTPDSYKDTVTVNVVY